MKTFFTSIFIVIIFINSVYPQTTFEKAIEIGKHDICYDIKRIEDFNYLIGTTSFGNNLDYSNLFIVKIDDAGNTIWKKVFFDFQLFGKANYQFDVNKDNDIVIAVPVYHSMSDDYSIETGIMLLIIDTNGVIKFIKTLKKGEEGGSVLSFEDGYLVENSNQLFKTNLSGDTVWSKVTVKNPSYGLYWNSANKTLDKNIVTVGNVSYYTENKSNTLISKIGSNGNLEWINNYSSNSLNFYPNKIIQTSDSGFVVTGYSVPKLGFDSPRPLFVLKVNNNGKKEWCKSYEFSERTNVGYDVKETNDKNLIVSGAINQLGVNEDMLIMKIRMTGELIWAKKYGGNSNDEGRAIISVNDGFISTGFTNSFSDDMDCFVIKTNSIGNVNDDDNLNSLYPKIEDIEISQNIQNSIFKNDTVSSILATNNKTYNIYPNPVSDVVHVYGLINDNNFAIKIYNLEGIKVYEKKSEGANIDIRNLMSGVYVMEILENGKINRFNIIKK